MKSAVESLLDQEKSEIKGLKPLLDEGELAFLLSSLKPILENHDYGKIPVFLDLEQLQITHYPSLFSDQDVREILEIIQNSGMYDQHELNFMALRSLITLSWPKPESNEQVRFMAETEAALHYAMIHMAEDMRSRHLNREVWLSYWARLAHFNLLRFLPDKLQYRFGPSGIPCILLRSRDINAHTYPLSSGYAVVLDYALEPFLKNINIFLQSYYSTRDFAGPKRVGRATAELIPRVLFFKGLAHACSLPSTNMLVGDNAVHSVKSTTDDQVSFLIAHEMGHIALNHPPEKRMFSKNQGNKIDHEELDHLYEYEADTFALNFLRSRVINSFRYFVHPKRLSNSEDTAKSIESLNESISDYAHYYLSIELLFLFMNFIDEMYAILASKVESLPKSSSSQGHPAPLKRWDRMKNHCLYDIELSSDFNEYSRNLLNSTLELTSTLTSNSIEELTSEVLKIETKS